MNKKGVLVKDADVLILGFTFKENCPDIRNTKVIDIYHTLEEYTANITVYDPYASTDTVMNDYGIAISNVAALQPKQYDAVVLAVAHDEFRHLDVRRLLKSEAGVVYDVKGILPKDMIDARL